MLITSEKFLFFGSRFSSSASALSGFPCAACLPSDGPSQLSGKNGIFTFPILVVGSMHSSHHSAHAA